MKHKCRGNNFSMYVRVYVHEWWELGLILLYNAHSVSPRRALKHTHTWLMGAVPFLTETLLHSCFISPGFSLYPVRSQMHFVWCSVSSQLFASKSLSSFPSKKEYKIISRSPCTAEKKLLIIYVCI